MSHFSSQGRLGMHPRNSLSFCMLSHQGIFFRPAMGTSSTGLSCCQRKALKMLQWWAPPPQHGCFALKTCLGQGSHGAVHSGLQAAKAAPAAPLPPGSLCHRSGQWHGREWVSSLQALAGAFVICGNFILAAAHKWDFAHHKARWAFVAFTYFPDIWKELCFLLLDFVTDFVKSSAPGIISHTKLFLQRHAV